MSQGKAPGGGGLPRQGRVNEMCQEWMVREDSALAYRLQNQEFDEHLSGNKFRNAVVREDFPRAKDEQLREQRMAEQAAAIYQKMLAEQEEVDNQIARELAEKIEREEALKRRAVEKQDQNIARQMLERERRKVERRQAAPMPLPVPEQQPTNQISTLSQFICNDVYNEPYRPVVPATSSKLNDLLNRIELADQDVGLPELSERDIQEQRDAEFARKLQAQEGSLEETILNRDRMLAIEAQDKELAQLLQQRERAKAKRAREKAKQKALAKKQQIGPDQLLPDDAYSSPVDVLIQEQRSDVYALPTSSQQDEDLNYSLPHDVLPATPAQRPTQLDLRAPLTKINKPRYPTPDELIQTADNPTNIAMAIDPTYSRRGPNPRISSAFDTPSTVTTSTSSSSPGGMTLPPADLNLLDDENPAPPYMPIQGQRRTASLEKKQKKRMKEGCKQQ